ncbi:uncharacterized protein I303_107466 [Kwoniella dejecticola CBS 10117]|uniref:CMGC protein kinase n=1 Tax=Kwoniella dejecticola CBS 10117 TaxID=1296121 RepID=A0A1A5ZZS7_9TREE|nr:CMGC protein kinase [Kwoniella dejecticola CBS 10117]OBR83307.1 CMGC protein kinase [Kwoniella dejecticola CBS 10117]
MIHIAQGRQGDIYAIQDPSSISRTTIRDDANRDHHLDDHASHQHQSLDLQDIDENGGLQGWQAIKLVYAPRHGAVKGRLPHNIRREVDLLRKIDHPNIIRVLGYTFDEETFEHRLVLPLYAITLTEMLQDQTFPFGPALHGGNVDNDDPRTTSSSLPSLSTTDRNKVAATSKWIAYQLLSGVNHLHSMDPPVAHRDLNTSNIMLDWNGILEIIDFGIAYSPPSEKTYDTDNHAERDVSPAQDDEGEEEVRENKGFLYCDVGTGPFRAPELLFSPTTYDPLEIDLWAVGCIIAQLFRPYTDRYEAVSTPSSPSSSSSSSSSTPAESCPTRQVEHTHDYEYDVEREGDDELEDPLDGRPNYITTPNRIRQPLFDSTYGSLGLISSIFKILGTPTHESWPGFNLLPDSSKIEFPHSNPKCLIDYLPEFNQVSKEDGRDILEILGNLLKLDPKARMSAQGVLNMRWFSGLPKGDPNTVGGKGVLGLWLDKARLTFNRKCIG